MGWWRHRKRARWMTEGLPADWWSMVDHRVPMVARYGARDRQRLGGITRVLVEEKRFDGCAGFVVTDEVRLTIAVQAAILVLHRPNDFYPTLHSILVYPAGYLARFEEAEDSGVVTEVEEERLGEAWPEGSVVLSWADVLLGAADEDDGRNVVFHEFAHLLDARTGDMDGLPDLAGLVDPQEWARVMGREYRRLSRASGGDRSPLWTSTAPRTPRSSSRSRPSCSLNDRSWPGSTPPSCTSFLFSITGKIPPPRLHEEVKTRNLSLSPVPW